MSQNTVQIIDVAVVGAGPAGLASAEVLCARGIRPALFEAKPSVARKFLMAGKSGLNLTKNEGLEPFLSAFSPCTPALREAIADFGPHQVQRWAEGLGQAVFTGSSGRVFPKSMKGSPLLRAWLARLDEGGAQFHLRWPLTGISPAKQGWECRFDTPEGPASRVAKSVILAMGGASWARLGSDGTWPDLLSPLGATCAPFKPANMGFDVNWSPHMEAHFGAPLKGVGLSVNGATTTGECVVSRNGFEGSAVYAISAALRDALETNVPATLNVDLLPERSGASLKAALKKALSGKKQSLSNVLRKSARLDPVKRALFFEAGACPRDAGDIAARLKSLPIQIERPRPMDEAISVAGGLSWDSLDARFMLQTADGIFAAGEMLDWEAPTGGYLLTGCIATGRAVGRAVADRLSSG